MLIPKGERIHDKKYRNSFKTAVCVVCGTSDGTVVGAHIRYNQSGGIGLKPSDDCVLPLCYRHHTDQERNPGPAWWVWNYLKLSPRLFADFGEAEKDEVFHDLMMVIKKIARSRYETWKSRLKS